MRIQIKLMIKYGVGRHIPILLIILVSMSSCQKINIDRKILIENDSVFNITTHSATARTTIEDMGYGIRAYGHRWDTIQDFNTGSGSTEQSELKETGSFDSKLSNLKAGKTYYIQSYVFDGKQYHFGKQINFQTLAYSVPEINTGSILQQDYFSIVIEGNIISLGPGGDLITQYGHCYSTVPNPTTEDAVTTFESTNSITNFTSELEVYPGNSYYIRAYAINEFDTVYGGEMSLEIPDISPRVIIEIDYSSITNSRATCYITCDYSAPVEIYTYGICWDTLALPDIYSADYYSNELTPGTGLKSTQTDLWELISKTKYFARTFVESNLGISYSEDLSFTTK